MANVGTVLPTTVAREETNGSLTEISPEEGVDNWIDRRLNDQEKQ